MFRVLPLHGLHFVHPAMRAPHCPSKLALTVLPSTCTCLRQLFSSRHIPSQAPPRHNLRLQYPVAHPGVTKSFDIWISRRFSITWPRQRYPFCRLRLFSSARLRASRLELPLPSPTAPRHTPTADMEYPSLKVPELRKILQERSLPTTGNKADLVARLQEDDKNKAPAAAAQPGTSPHTSSAVAVPDPLRARESSHFRVRRLRTFPRPVPMHVRV